MDLCRRASAELTCAIPESVMLISWQDVLHVSSKSSV